MLLKLNHIRLLSAFTALMFVIEINAQETEYSIKQKQGCTPFEAHFSCNPTTDESLLWDFGDKNVSTKANTSHVYNDAGKYLVTLTSNGKLLLSDTVMVLPKPRATFKLTVKNEEKIQFTSKSKTKSGLKYYWDFGDGNSTDAINPVHKYNAKGEYSVRLTTCNEYGCSDSSEFIYTYDTSDKCLKFPTGFMPDKSGANGGSYSVQTDVTIFHPTYNGVDEYDLSIYNRKGVLIFESDDIDIGWDGYYNDKLCSEDGYFYYSTGVFYDGTEFNYTGSLILVH